MILRVVIVRLLRLNYLEFRVGLECNDWHPWKKRRWVKTKTDENDASTVSQSRVGSRPYKLEDRHRWFSLSTHRRNQNRWYPDFRLVLLKGERPPFCCFCYQVQLLREPQESTAPMKGSFCSSSLRSELEMNPKSGVKLRWCIQHRKLIM